MIDRGNAELSEEELKELLGIYQAQIDAGVQTIMISDSSVNGIRMSEHKELLRYLKEDMGFDGFLVTDWNAVKTTSAETYKEKIITVINSGILKTKYKNLFQLLIIEQHQAKEISLSFCWQLNWEYDLAISAD